MKRKHVLLVDDDTDFVSVNKLHLEQQGYDVATAGNGAECLQCIDRCKPDLIILDMMMTCEDEGFDVSHNLGNSELTRQIPILMVSAINKNSLFTLNPDATWLPVDVFLEKPVDHKRLLQEISRILT